MAFEIQKYRFIHLFVPLCTCNFFYDFYLGYLIRISIYDTLNQKGP